jgi:hypothetical protein
MSEPRRLPLAAIDDDLAIQQRVDGTSDEVVREYAQAMRDGDEFPPVVVFSNDGVTYHLADGFHRIKAHRLAHPDEQEINCEVRPGDCDNALLFACGANASHGHRRTVADKKKAVLRLLTVERCSQWSDRDIARQCNVSHPFVGKVRAHLETLPDQDGKGGDQAACTLSPFSAIDAPTPASDRRRKVKRGGVSYDMKTGAIGSRPARASSRRHVESDPRLRSLNWSEASKPARAIFADAVGMHEFLDAYKMQNPRFEVLTWAWKVSGQAERQSFAKEHRDEINALASPGTPLVADGSKTPDATPSELRPDEDPLDIPPCLRRGHADRPVKTGSAE